MAIHKHSEVAINRSLIVLLPNQSAFDRLLQADPEPMHMTLTQLRRTLMVSIRKRHWFCRSIKRQHTRK